MSGKEKVQLFFLSAVLLLGTALLFFTPTLRPLSLLTLFTVLILSPSISLLERRGIHRDFSILIVFVITGAAVTFSALLMSQVVANQWNTLASRFPEYWQIGLQQIDQIQARIRDTLGFELNFGFTDSLRSLAGQFQVWLVSGLPSALGQLASLLIFVPVFSFFVLKDGKKLQTQFFRLVPKAYQRASFVVVSKISRTLSHFLRAKFLEAFLVGVLALMGLLIIGAPYPFVLALVIGLTNILPYFGPILGAIPPLVLCWVSPDAKHLFLPMCITLGVVNAIDMIFIFPVLVGRMVNLSPLWLLLAVTAGQQFYGVVGMLIAVPVASAIKITFEEMYRLVYESESQKSSSS